MAENLEDFNTELDRRGVTDVASRKRLVTNWENLKRHQRAKQDFEAKVQGVLKNRAQAREQFPTASAIGQPLGAFGAGVTQGATFGQAAEVTSPVNALLSGESRAAAERSTEARFEAARQENPNAFFAGELAGGFVGAGGAAFRGAGALGQRAGSALLRRVGLRAAVDTGGRRLTERVAAGLVEAGGAGAAAILTSNLLRDREDGGGLADRFATAGREILSPTNLGITLAFGSAAGALRARPDDNLARVLARVSRFSQDFRRTTPGELRPGGFLQSAIGNIGKYSLGRRLTQQVVIIGLIQPFQTAVQQLSNRFYTGAAGSVTRVAANRARQFVGLKESQHAGLVERERIRLQDRLYAQYGDTPVPEDALIGFLTNIRDTGRQIARPRGGLSPLEPRGAQLSAPIQRLRALARDILTQRNLLANEKRTGIRDPRIRGATRRGETNLTLRDFSDLRQSVDEVADFNRVAKSNSLDIRVSGRDEREAKLLRGVFRRLDREIEPAFDRGLRTIRGMREIERSLDPVVASVRDKMDRGVLESMLQDKKLRLRLGAWQNMDPQGFSAFQGHYFARFLEDAFTTNESGRVPERVLSLTVSRMLRGSGPYRREVFDRVLGPDVREFIEDMAFLERRWAGGAGQASNSLTAQRLGDAALIGAGIKAPEILLDTLIDVSHGRFETLGRRMVGFSSAIFTAAAIRSLLHEGRLARSLNTLATGGRLQAPSRLPVAIQRAQDLGEESTGALPRLGGAALGLVNRLPGPVERGRSR